ncbi:MAG TPA: PKD domain-containing protein, partial [Phaeodactylibacter sp.]|nr:PKD domain-containing protein [Phaeodactylibacter sp.]
MSIRYTFLVLFLSLSLNITAQIQEQAPGTDDLGEIPIWVQLLYGESPQPEEVIAAYEAYYEQHPFVKNGHTQYYKHWLRNLSRDVNGTFTGAVSMRDAKEEEEKYLARSAQVRAERGPNSAWACIGPYDFDQEAAGRSYAPGSAHVYTIEKAPSNPNIVYAGTATAGLFKSTDNGISWTLATRDVMVNGIRAIEIDPNDENTIFFGAAGSLYKSTDGGSTWNVVGDAAFQNLSHSISDIVARPGSSTDYFLCSDQGLYYTSDAGSNWALLLGGDAKELEFHPTNANIVYFVQRSGDVTEFYKSTDEGVNWTLKPTGWPAPDTGAGEEQKRTEIAVSPAQPGYVYALATGVANGGSGLYGVYISTDEGETWSFSCCGPQPAGPPSSSNINMMGWSDEGLDNGGQYYYDLAFAVSPTQADSIHVGGVNHWVSADGGTTFTCPSKWSHPHKPQYVHADIHDIRYYGSELWVACDGGLFYSNDGGANFTHRMVGIEGTDFWGFGAGFRDGEVLLGGTYHNGTLLKDNNVYINDWICTRGGDNVRGFVNPSHDNIVYDDGGKRILPSDRTLDFAEFSFSMRPNASYIVGRSSNIAFHSYSPNVSYSGVGTVLWKTENDGSTFVQIYDFGAGNELGEIRVAPSDPNTIYVATHSGTSSSGLDKVWRSTDGGSSFTNISPLTANVPYSITVDGDDAQTLWAARTIEWTWQGYLNGNKVFKSTDGGNNWTNISGSALNGEYLTNILHQKGTDGGVYVATRRAVYYKNNTMSDFALFNNNLPASTTSTRLVANYGDGKLYNGTNRSVYKVDFYEDSEPIAQIAAEKFEASCLNEPIQFFSNSAALRTASYSWSFPGGTPSTSTQRDPIVLYDTEGTYDVTLTVTDANGTDTQTLSNFITVYNACSPETVPGKALSLTGASSDYGIAPAPGFTTNHYTVAAWIKRDGDQADWAGIVNTRPTAGAAALNFGYNNQLRYHWGGSSTWGWNSGLIVPDNEWTH